MCHMTFSSLITNLVVLEPQGVKKDNWNYNLIALTPDKQEVCEV